MYVNPSTRLTNGQALLVVLALLVLAAQLVLAGVGTIYLAAGNLDAAQLAFAFAFGPTAGMVMGA